MGFEPTTPTLARLPAGPTDARVFGSLTGYDKK